jgi:peroxiredoxin
LAATVDRLVSRLRENEAGKTAPDVGDAMPPFVLPDEQGQLVTLEGLLDNGSVAVTFHRGHWCPYCRISINALGRAQRELEKSGTGRIIAVMPDRQQFADRFKSEAEAAIPILTDMDNGYALSLNLMFWMGEELQQFYSGTDWAIPKFQGNDAWMLPIPATFVVGTDGRIRARFVDPDYRKRMSIEEMLRALREPHQPM